jgi:hypothetical protein
VTLQDCFLCRGPGARVGPTRFPGGGPDSGKRFSVLCATCGGYKIEERMTVSGAIPEKVGRKLSRVARDQPDASEILSVTAELVRSLS